MPWICVPSADVSPAMPFFLEKNDIFIAGPNVPRTDVDKVAVEIPIFFFWSTGSPNSYVETQQYYSVMKSMQ